MPASEQEAHPSTPLPSRRSPILQPHPGKCRFRGSTCSPGRLRKNHNAHHTLFKHAEFKDASVSKKRLNTTGELHIAITKAGHRNKPEFWVINSLLSGFIQMLCRYTLLPFILLNPNLTLRFPFAVHLKRHFGAISPVSSIFGGILSTLSMFYENNTWGQLYSHAEPHTEAGGSAKDRAQCSSLQDRQTQARSQDQELHKLVAPSAKLEYFTLRNETIKQEAGILRYSTLKSLLQFRGKRTT